jgi:hypothetical protein
MSRPADPISETRGNVSFEMLALRRPVNRTGGSLWMWLLADYPLRLVPIAAETVASAR